MNLEVSLGVAMFTAIVLALVLIILFARSQLVSSGSVNIEINGEKTITVPAGDKLLQTLAANDLFLASACGGGGTCAQCKCIVSDGGGALLPTYQVQAPTRSAMRSLFSVLLPIQSSPLPLVLSPLLLGSLERAQAKNPPQEAQDDGHARQMVGVQMGVGSMVVSDGAQFQEVNKSGLGASALLQEELKA